VIRRTGHVRYAQVNDFRTQCACKLGLNSLPRAEVSCCVKHRWMVFKTSLFLGLFFEGVAVRAGRQGLDFE
jgi:hypothetical protein